MYGIISKILILILVKARKKLEVRGKEHIPQLNRFVVTCNHQGYNEIIMLALAMRPKSIHFMAKKELFENKFLDKFFRMVHAFPVNREKPGPSTLKVPINLLKQNKTVGMFPSGHRTTENVPLKRGAATIALLSNAKLLPAAYIGPSEIKKIASEKAYIQFGEPIDVTKISPELSRSEKLTYLTQELEKRMNEVHADLKAYVETQQ